MCELHRFVRLKLHLYSRRRRQLFAECATSRVLWRGLLARLAPTHVQLRLALSNHLGAIHGVGPKPSRQRRVCDAASFADSNRAQPSAELPQTNRASPWDRLLARHQREDRDSRRLWHLLRRSGAERMGNGIPRGKRFKLHHWNLQPQWRSRYVCSHWYGLSDGRRRGDGYLIGSPYKTPYAIHTTAGVQHAFSDHWLMSADFVHEQGNHGYRGFPYTSGTNLFTPLIPTTDPNYVTDQANVVP